MTREDIIAGLTRSPAAFAVECGGRTLELHLMPWGSAERQAFQAEHRERGAAALYERLFLTSVCDAAGRLLFGPGDVDAVSALDGAALERVAERVLRLNGLVGDDAPGKASSPTGPPASSSAGSPSPSG